ncbi:hypothetical protein GGX14DRAFT_394262 [Mycena pura]|uniref:CFEM domain-containing protein n=1 Tax=Mycena pura TaxID=153505 RepID=A0AAD6YCD4_9AGAR|nr:hypothetical protein GGX14DRAFT_394262 [Mycena pura]
MLLPIILSVGGFLLSANIAGVGAQDSGSGLTPECLIDCGNIAAEATNCANGFLNASCVCASPTFNASFTACATANTCNATADEITGSITSSCGTPSQPGSAIALNGRVGLAAVSAVCQFCQPSVSLAHLGIGPGELRMSAAWRTYGCNVV